MTTPKDKLGNEENVVQLVHMMHIYVTAEAVSYTHLTLPTTAEV